jgi:hypothetical protein
LVDGEAGWGVGIKKRGVTPSLLIPAQQSIIEYRIPTKPLCEHPMEFAEEKNPRRFGYKWMIWIKQGGGLPLEGGGGAQ